MVTRFPVLLLVLVYASILFSIVECQRVLQGAYNVIWTTATNETDTSYFRGSMPLGNGDCQVSAWANVSAGGLSFYIAKQDAMHSDTSLYKVALVTVALNPNPFKAGAYFNQTHDLASARVVIEAGGAGHDFAAIVISVWVDAFSNTVYVTAVSGPGDPTAAFSLSVLLTPVRLSGYERTVGVYECTASSSAPDVAASSIPAGLFPSGPNGTIVLFHANNPGSDIDGGSYIGAVLRAQGLSDVINTVPDLWINRRFGVAIDSAPGRVPGCGLVQPGGRLVRDSSLQLSSVAPSPCFAVRTSVLSEQSPTDDSWLAALGAQVSLQPQSGPPLDAHVQYWTSFWNKSWVDIDTDEVAPAPFIGSLGAALSQAYAVSRFMNAVQSRVVQAGTAQMPIKFNGGAWLSDKPVNSTSVLSGPDSRDWGSPNWWQNLRLPYGPMLADGDWAEQDVMFDYYLRMIPFLRARSDTLLPSTNSSVGFWQVETATVFGAYSEVDYGSCGSFSPRPPSMPVWLIPNPYVALDHFGGMYHGYLYDGNSTLLRNRLPWIVAALDSFTFNFPNRTREGNVVICPSQALETYWCPFPFDFNPGGECVSGDAPTIATVSRLLQRLLQLPIVDPPFVNPDQLVAWSLLFSQMPSLPVNLVSGTFAPAISFNATSHNSESVGMYAVHPARTFSVGTNLTRPGGINLTVAVASYFSDPDASGHNDGWHQGVMHAPLLGLRDNAATMFKGRLTSGTVLPGYRFPYFIGEDGMADEPSVEHYANLAAGIQWALLQPGDNDAVGDVIAFPGWPCSWNVSFRLRAPKEAAVTAKWSGGRLEALTVDPPSRTSYVQLAPGC